MTDLENKNANPQSIQSPFLQLLKDSSIHGVKYTAQTNCPLLERCLWTIIILTSFGASGYFIYGVFEKYNQSPVIVSFEPSQISIADIPFPAVTICNANRFRKSHFYNLWKFVNERKPILPTDIEEVEDYKTLLRQLDHICSLSNSFSNTFNYSVNETTSNLCGREADFAFGCGVGQTDRQDSLRVDQDYKDSVIRRLYLAIPTCKEMIPLCVWEGEVRDCAQMFEQTVTDMGFCCSFNIMPKGMMVHTGAEDIQYSEEQKFFWSDFNFDEILQNEDTERTKLKNKYLAYQSKAGQASGLSLLLNPELDEYFCGNHNAFGFRIHTHSAIDYPHVAEYGVAVPPNNEVFMAIQAELTKSDSEIRDLNVETRQCYYTNEKKLDEYKVYTGGNCIDECIAMIIARKCHCVRFDMALRFADPELKNITYCEGRGLQCAREVSRNISHEGTKKVCAACKPSCNKIDYIPQTSSLPLRPDFHVTIPNEMKGNRSIGKNFTIVHIFFASDIVYSRIRKNLYTTVGFISNIGGILGLFLGLSMISILEPLNYFLPKYGGQNESNMEPNLNSIGKRKSKKQKTKSIGEGGFQECYRYNKNIPTIWKPNSPEAYRSGVNFYFK